MKTSDKVFYLAPEKALIEEPQEQEVYTLGQAEPVRAAAFDLGEKLSDIPLPEPAESKPVPVEAPKFELPASSERQVFTAKSELEKHLMKLAELIANVTEAYTVSIFLADHTNRVLRVAGAHTLSREFAVKAEIGFGCGLVGWTAENAVRISVCPFEHDATTLLYYTKDQDLKSFIAVPILDEAKTLLGVISCDSKKSYAFAKITEKILLDCAGQAGAFIKLIRKQAAVKVEPDNKHEHQLDKVLEKLRELDEERTLLSTAAELPAEIVARDALVVMTPAEGGVGQGTFYASSNQTHVGHRLLELVCRHNKIICGERSVHALPTDDIKQRSFLSIPFHVLEREAGSLNLLSRPYEAFNDREIAALEKIAKVIGRSLERIRLRDRLGAAADAANLLSWKHFTIQAQARMNEASAKKNVLSLIRFSFSNIAELEELAGIEVANAAVARVLRLIEQVARPPAISCCLYGTQVLTLAESSEAQVIVMRLRRLIERMSGADFGRDHSALGVKVGQLLNKGLLTASAVYPKDASNVTDLASLTRGLLHASVEKQTIGEVANAGNW